MPRLCQLALFDATDKTLFLNIKTSIEVSRQTNMMEKHGYKEMHGYKEFYRYNKKYEDEQ